MSPDLLTFTEFGRILFVFSENLVLKYKYLPSHIGRLPGDMSSTHKARTLSDQMHSDLLNYYCIKVPAKQKWRVVLPHLFLSHFHTTD